MLTTPSGVVYGSGAFAALAKANDVTEFSCTYVGRTPLALETGRCREADELYARHAERRDVSLEERSAYAQRLRRFFNQPT